jgi:general secretion pathway protein F
MTSQPDPAPRNPRPISLDELILLNDELRALLRAGIPLDVGLRGSRSRISGRLGHLTERLATRIESGASLDEALAAEQGTVPASYRAVLAAGLRSGRFEDVLRAMSEFASAMRDLRDHVGRALIYPSTVILIAYILFMGMVNWFVPHLQQTYDTFRLPSNWWLNVLARLHEWLPVWGPLVPLLVCAILCGPRILAFVSRIIGDDCESRAVRLGALYVAPGIGSVLRSAQLARFSHLLSLLVKFDVPLPEALRLSAAGTADRALVNAAESVALRIEAGGALDEALSPSAIPAFLRWLMIAGQRQSRLPQTLEQAAAVYRQRAVLRAEWIQKLFPLVVVLVIGGGATMIYALTVFLPMSALWQHLGG